MKSLILYLTYSTRFASEQSWNTVINSINEPLWETSHLSRYALLSFALEARFLDECFLWDAKWTRIFLIVTTVSWGPFSLLYQFSALYDSRTGKTAVVFPRIGVLSAVHCTVQITIYRLSHLNMFVYNIDYIINDFCVIEFEETS